MKALQGFSSSFIKVVMKFGALILVFTGFAHPLGLFLHIKGIARSFACEVFFER